MFNVADIVVIAIIIIAIFMGYKKGFEIIVCASDIPMTDDFIEYLDKKLSTELSTGSLKNS